MNGVAEVRDDEPLERLRRLALEEQRQPEDDRHGSGGEAPEPDHDQVGDREQKAEEHGDARALEVVGDDDPDGRRRRAAGARRSPATVWRLWRSAAPFVYDRAVPEAPVTPDDVRRAQRSHRDAVHRTPTFSSRSLGPAGT